MSCSPHDLIPVPQHTTVRPGGFEAGRLAWRCSPGAAKNIAVGWKLREELRIDLCVDPSLGELELRIGEPCLEGLEAPRRAQGYALRAEPCGALLKGTDVDGFYWGLVTLEQLLDGGTYLPACEIRDWPAFALRGHHDDISRKQISKPADFLRIIRRLSQYKINVYTPYMEDVLFLRSFPDIGEGRGRLTPDELAAMHLEAARHNVMVLPTYSLGGHQENLLAHPKYAQLGRRVFQPMSTYDLGSSAVKEFLRTVIADVCALFPAPYFHAGFDEMIGVGGEEFLEHANWCAGELAAHGKTMVMWADMLYNHFGVERIASLAPSIIPVNWCYDANPAERSSHGKVVRHADLCAQGRPVWGLAGYGNCCRFMPEVRATKANIDAWVRTGLATGTPALFASQWGDEGYENHREQAWNLFAYLGEAAWSGPAARSADFERRFQRHFYGVALPVLDAVLHDVPDRLSLGLGEYWKLFRRSARCFNRRAAGTPSSAVALAADERALVEALEQVDACRRQAHRNADHLEHFSVGLARMLNVTRRQQFAADLVAGLPADETARRVAAIKQELEALRDRYVAAWLATNKAPNIEVSLKVFDDVLDSYAFLLLQGSDERDATGRFQTLDLGSAFNRNQTDAEDAPVGPWTTNGVPFLFAGLDRTHAAFTSADAPLVFPFAPADVVDLHLVVAGHRRTDDPHPALRVELLRGGQVVFAEDLLNVVHLCDWWAPLGEHMWAGGGMAHADADRVRYAVRLGPLTGAAEVFRFDFHSHHVHADTLRLTALCGDEIRLFAATLEEPLP